MAHFNHQLRPESDADERACRQQADASGLLAKLGISAEGLKRTVADFNAAFGFMTRAALIAASATAWLG